MTDDDKVSADAFAEALLEMHKCHGDELDPMSFVDAIAAAHGVTVRELIEDFLSERLTSPSTSIH